MEELTHFNKLFSVNCNDKTEKKSNGSTQLTYLSWTYAWQEVKKIFPNAKYEIEKFGENRLPYIYDEKTGYMVFTKVEIEGIEHEMWLPVMDSANKAMKDKPYTYKAKEYNYGKFTGKYIDKTVESATMFDINKTIMRCLTKNLAMFGLGLYIYAGEDLPENVDAENNVPKQEKKISNKREEVTPYDFEEDKMTEEQLKTISSLEQPLKEQLRTFYKKDPTQLTKLEAESAIKSLNEKGLIKTKEQIERERKESEEIFQ